MIEMENLSISDQPGGSPLPPGARPQMHSPHMMMQQQPPVPQLPPQMFTTAAQLLDLTDKKLMVALRDGRKLIGVLRSWDQFANIVLQSAVERIFAPFPAADSSAADDGRAGSEPAGPRGLYADIPRGLYLVRGENVLLLGEIDLDKDDDPPPGYRLAEPGVVVRMTAERKAAEKAREKSRLAGLARHGFEGENLGDLIL